MLIPLVTLAVAIWFGQATAKDVAQAQAIAGMQRQLHTTAGTRAWWHAMSAAALGCAIVAFALVVTWRWLP